MTNLLSELNAEQRQVVQTTDGPVLVLAGAGSGKTRALIYRIAYLLDTKKAHPHEIMAVTFTNKAAGEMKERVGKLVMNNCPVPRTICTFHSLGVRILREQNELISRSSSFTVCDSGDSERLIKSAMDDLEISRKEHSVSKIKHKISQAKMRRERAADVMSSGHRDSEMVAAIFSRYEKLLARNDAYDFDDLIIRPLDLLEAHPNVKHTYQQKWRYLSVDEYQDTNPPQDRLLELLVGPERNICVVGDDYQAIYSWRGAKVDHILQFEKKYPGCKTIYLTRNYRSTPQILNAANTVIAENTEQKHKKLWTKKDKGKQVKIVELPNSYQEATFVRKQIEEQVQTGGKRQDCVVLYRTNAQSRAFEEDFLKYGVPYNIVGGFRFYERREIKDAIAFLQLWVNNNSLLAVQRIAGAMWRGVGPKTLVKWDQQTEEGHNLMHVIGAQNNRLPVVGKFIDVYRAAKEKEFKLVSDLLSFMLKESGYLKMIEDLPDGEERLENLEELISVSASFSDVSKFLEEVALLSDIDSLEQEHDRVTCMTLHAAKGLEYPVVFVVGCEENLLPHVNSVEKASELEEERRLLYVGMTRALNCLWLTYTRSRYQHGQYIPQSPSRFLRVLEGSGEWITHGEEVSSLGISDDIKKYLEMESSSETTVVEVEEGHFVKHDSFGRGVVIDVRGSLVTCVFEAHGVKTIEASHLQSQEFSEGI